MTKKREAAAAAVSTDHPSSSTRGTSGHSTRSISGISSRPRTCVVRCVRINPRTSSASTHAASPAAGTAEVVSGFTP
jgi:hypothetical protein